MNFPVKRIPVTARLVRVVGVRAFANLLLDTDRLLDAGGRVFLAGDSRVGGRDEHDAACLTDGECDAGVAVASNVDLAESDLTPMDAQELVAAAEGHAGGARAAGADPAATAEAQERAQKVWWYLLFAGILLLGAETILSNGIALRSGDRSVRL